MALFDPKWLMSGIARDDLGCVPLAPYTSLAGQQFDHFQYWVNRHFKPSSYVQLRSDSQEHARYFGHVGRGDISLYSLSLGNDSHIYSPCDDALYLILLLDGKGLHCSSGQHLDSKTPEFFVQLPGEPLNFVFIKQSQQLVIRIDRSFLDANQSRFDPLSLTASSDKLAFVKTATFNLLAALKISQSFHQSELLVDRWCEDIEGVLTGSKIIPCRTVSYDELPDYLQGFLDQLLLADQSVSMNDIVRNVSVSSRKLYQDFQRLLECSPYQFIKLHRLRRIHMAMMKQDDWRLSDIATIHGFSHLGRFSSYYQSVFGELPSVVRSKFKDTIATIDLNNELRGENDCWMTGNARGPVKEMDMRCQNCIKCLRAA